MVQVNLLGKLCWNIQQLIHVLEVKFLHTSERKRNRCYWKRFLWRHFLTSSFCIRIFGGPVSVTSRTRTGNPNSYNISKPHVANVRYQTFSRRKACWIDLFVSKKPKAFILLFIPTHRVIELSKVILYSANITHHICWISWICLMILLTCLGDTILVPEWWTYCKANAFIATVAGQYVVNICLGGIMSITTSDGKTSRLVHHGH